MYFFENYFDKFCICPFFVVPLQSQICFMGVFGFDSR